MYIIITNNNLLSPIFVGSRYPIETIQGELDAIYSAISHRLQNGFKLVSSPLPANVPLIRSPIRSVILQRHSKQYDKGGLLMLEKAQERTKTLGINTDTGVRDDLCMIDADQLRRALLQLEILGTLTADQPCKSMASPHLACTTE